MSRPSATSFKMKFAAFVSTDDARIEFAIEEAVLECGEFGDGYWLNDGNQTLAVYYLAAHKLQVALMRASSGTGQIISSERVPDMSITYAVPSQDKPIDFNMTIYGQEFDRIIRRNFSYPFVANCGVRM